MSGWNGSGRKGSTPAQPKVAAKRSSPIRGIVVGAMLIAVGCVVIFVFSPGTTVKPQAEKVEKEHGRIKAVTPAAASKVVMCEEPKIVKKEEKKPQAPSLRDESLSETQREELYEKQLAEEKIPNPTNRAFRTGLEQVTSWVFSTRLGDAPPPLPEISDFDLVHFQEIMNHKNEVKDGDSERDAIAKETVDYVKKELKEYVDKGGDPQEFLAFYHSQLRDAHEQLKMAQEQVDRILETDPDIALDYLKKVNKSLAEKGIRGAIISPRDRDRYGLPDEEEEEGEDK